MWKVRETQVSTIVTSLCKNIFSEKEELRDICGIGMKTVIAQFPKTSGGVAVSSSRHICDSFLTAIETKSVDTYILLEVLDVLAELIQKYSSLFPYCCLV